MYGATLGSGESDLNKDADKVDKGSKTQGMSFSNFMSLMKNGV